MTPPPDLTHEDGAVLDSARQTGRIEARVFDRGDFSEEGFLLYGRLEQLCARGLLRFVSWTGDATGAASEVAAVFVPTRPAA